MTTNHLARYPTLLPLVLAVCILFPLPHPLHAAIIYVGDVVEDKGTITTVVGHNEFTSSMTIVLHAPDWGERAGTYTRVNREVFVIDQEMTEHFYNIYPIFIEIPDPIDLQSGITIPFFMATGNSETDLRPMPDNGSVDSAELEDGYGHPHGAAFTSFFDVFVDLPLTGPNGEEYLWDTSGFSQSQGNFQLAGVTMTVDQFTAPEPNTAWLLMGAVLVWGFRSMRRVPALRDSGPDLNDAISGRLSNISGKGSLEGIPDISQ